MLTMPGASWERIRCSRPLPLSPWHSALVLASQILPSSAAFFFGPCLTVTRPVWCACTKLIRPATPTCPHFPRRTSTTSPGSRTFSKISVRIGIPRGPAVRRTLSQRSRRTGLSGHGICGQGILLYPGCTTIAWTSFPARGKYRRQRCRCDPQLCVMAKAVSLRSRRDRAQNSVGRRTECCTRCDARIVPVSRAKSISGRRYQESPTTRSHTFVDCAGSVLWPASSRGSRRSRPPLHMPFASPVPRDCNRRARQKSAQRRPEKEKGLGSEALFDLFIENVFS